MTVLKPHEIPTEAHCRIVDVREPDEYWQEHIPGSQNLPLSQLHQEAAALAGKEVILSCRSGRRAEEARRILEAQGCRNVQLLEGGLLGWKAAGQPTRRLKKGFSIMQQVQIIAGSMILLGSFVKPVWFLAPLAGLGLLTAGLTNTCMMASILAKMPWNRQPDGGSCTTGNCTLPGSDTSRLAS